MNNAVSLPPMVFLKSAAFNCERFSVQLIFVSVINSYSYANKIKKRFTAKEINNKNLHKGKMVRFCPYADFLSMWLTVRFIDS